MKLINFKNNMIMSTMENVSVVILTVWTFIVGMYAGRVYESKKRKKNKLS